MNRAPCIYERNGGERCAPCNERFRGIAFGEDTGGDCEWYATHTRGDVEPITLAEAHQEIADREEADCRRIA